MNDYTNDILRYQRGEMTMQERHALEKRSLEDPFLADALDGLEILPPDEAVRDIQALTLKLENRLVKREGRVVSLTVWIARIAAGLVLAVLSTIALIKWVDTDQPSTLALHQEKQQELLSNQDGQEQIPISADSLNQRKNLLSLEKPKAQQQETRSAEVPQVQHEPKALADENKQDVLLAYQHDSEEVADEGAPEEQPVTAATEDQAKIELDAKLADKSTVEFAKKRAVDVAAASKTSLTPPTKERVIRGQVTAAEDGIGLPGVNVVIKGTAIGAFTDALGHYELPIGEHSPTVVFSFIGYQNIEVQSKPEAELNVALEVDVSQLSEVVVIGYGSERDDSIFSPYDYTSLQLATPEGGKRVFKQYLEQQLRYPQQAIEHKIEGKVTVQFTIEPTGQLSEFKVIRSIGYGCDEELIRLIKQGPKWSPTKRKEEAIRDKVRVRMKFELPKK